MKANHIPVEKRLLSRIYKLQNELDNSMKRSRKRFYMFCQYCDQTVITVAMKGHGSGCKVYGHAKQIVHYRKLLDQVRQPAVS